MKSNNIIWLASYPKSGNTWFRSFITALYSDTEIDINKLGTDGIFSDKNLFENVLDVDADDVIHEQAVAFQRLVYPYTSAKSKKTMFVKIHDAYTFSKTDNLPLIPSAGTKMAIYLVRNPLDVTLSLANHVGKSLDKTIDKFITNTEGAFFKHQMLGLSQFYQPLGTWSMHVASWKQHPDFPVHFIRYEDIKAKPFETFKAAVNAMNLPFSDEQIQRAINETEFEKLQKKENEKGFREKQNTSTLFFNKGEVGRWKTELTPEQIQKIRTANEPMMKAFDYW